MAPTSPADPPQPSLTSFLQHLASLVSSPSCPASLFIHSPTASPLLLPSLLTLLDAATATATALPPPVDQPSVEHLLPKVAVIDLEQVHSTKAAFDRVLNRLSGWDTAKEGGARWEDRDGGIRNWEGSMHGLRVARTARKRRASGRARARGRRKRARMEEEDSQDEGADVQDVDGLDHEYDGDSVDEVEEWTLEWDREAASTSLFTKPTLAPIRDTVEAFHHSLSTIVSFSAPSSSPASDSLDPGIALSRTKPAVSRRFIVIAHGELLGDLAGSAGGGAGAAKETGMGMTFASTIHRLGEQSELPITTITLSRLPWRKARETMVGLPSPEVLTFDEISQSDAVTLLTARFLSSPLSQSPPDSTLSREQLVALFRSLVVVVRSTFGKAIGPDLDALAWLCAKFWPRWMEAVEKSNPPIAPTDTARLSIALKPDFAAELDKIGLPRPSLSAFSTTSPSPHGPAHTPQLHGFAGSIAAAPKQPTYLTPAPDSSVQDEASSPSGGSANFFAAATTGRAGDARSADYFVPSASPPLRRQALPSPSHPVLPALSATSSPAQALAKSLPVSARFLLLAAYFAAVNPPKSDVRMFVRVDETEGVAKKGKKGRKGRAKVPGTGGKTGTLAAALSGGKPFAYERMIAIYESIIDERRDYTVGSVAIGGQVQTLLSLRLLQRASSSADTAKNADKLLDGVKLRCSLAREVVDGLARSVGWNEWRERVVGVNE
ncbi:hypothetical protein JCM21900_005286 [Sporobolomyces salmonicolor]